MTTDNESNAASFETMPLTPEVRKALLDMGFTSPTPVQAAAYEPVVAGKDLIVQAQTGTGKTAGFGIPLVDRRVTPQGGVQALILAPTRELALQSAKEISRIGVHRGIRTAAVYGGAPFEPQVRALAGGAEIVSGTPGRVLDHLQRGTLDASSLCTLVLDEADEMLSMGFARELYQIVEMLPAKRQTLLFSATVADDIQFLARRYMNDPEFITLSSDRVGAAGISHFVYFVSGGGRAKDLVRVLEIEDPENAIIFCNTKAETETVAQTLVQHGFNADWLNGDLPQSDRERVMARTRSGELRYLVATDVAARGIDVSHLTHVINYTFPPDVAQYIHRTGRTGRAGRTGTAFSLVSPQEIGSLYYLRLQYKIFPVERSLPDKGEEATRREMDRIAMLDAAFTKAPSDGHLRVAERLLTHSDRERIIGGLLATFFGEEAPSVDETAAAARRSRRPVIESEPEPRRDARPAPRSESRSEGRSMSREPRGDGRSESRRPPRERVRERPRPSDEPRAQSELPLDDTADNDAGVDLDRERVRLFVGVGRRDGARAGALSRLLRDDCGLAGEEIGRIRVRDKHTFVEVDPGRADHVVTTLNGRDYEGRPLLVEVARAQSAHP
jgi:ATP-dependent RNA helicase DeaD